MKRVGLLGGTFDPVHIGHLRSASIVKQQLRLDEMHILPLSIPVHKHAPVANNQQRLQCLQLALKSFPCLQIETVELERKGESYTVDTLRYLDKQHPGYQYYWLLGMDAFNGFTAWKDPGEILQLANLVVMNRPGNPMSPDIKLQYAAHLCKPEDLLTEKQAIGSIVQIDIPPIDVSSTQLRAWLAVDDIEKANDYMPEQVLDYISQEKIYATKREPMKVEQIKDQIVDALEEIKGIDTVVLPIDKMTSVADYLIVSSGGSNRQVKSLANNVLMKLKKLDIRPLGVEGEREAQWVLIDYGDILVHIMVPETRDFYNLEKLWGQRPDSFDSADVAND